MVKSLFVFLLSKKYVFLQSTNQYQTIQQHTMTNTATGPRKRQRKKRSSAKQQPSMGLASLRQHQNVTLRRSEECLNTSTPESSTSESDHDQGSIAWVLTPAFRVALVRRLTSAEFAFLFMVSNPYVYITIDYYSDNFES